VPILIAGKRETVAHHRRQHPTHNWVEPVRPAQATPQTRSPTDEFVRNAAGDRFADLE